MTTYTDAQIIAAVGAAIRADDIQAVPGLIALLALQNPREAELLRGSILDALAVLESAR
jgi:hypothetical protein